MSTPADSHPVRTGIISTVAGTIAVAVLAELWPPVKNSLVWVWIQLKAFSGLFTAYYSTPGWLLAGLGILSLIALGRWVSALLTRDTEEDSAFRAYTTDSLYGANWRWSWIGHEISNLWCFCPSCDSELVYDDSSCRDILRTQEPRTEFICEHCGHSHITSIKGGNKHYALSAVQREIRRKLRTGQTPTAAQAEV